MFHILLLLYFTSVAGAKKLNFYQLVMEKHVRQKTKFKPLEKSYMISIEFKHRCRI